MGSIVGLSRSLFLICLAITLSACARHSGRSDSPPFPHAEDLSVQLGPANISGQGSRLIGAVNISANSGSIEIEGRKYTSYVYDTIPWTAYMETLYQGIAADESHLFIYWVYCNEQGQIENIFFEGTNGPEIQNETASGTCGNLPVSEASAPAPTLAPRIADIQPKSLLAGFKIQGGNLVYPAADPSGRSDLPGVYMDQADNKTFDVYPFGLVDCSACANPGWLELHSLLVDQNSDQACFAIIYLKADKTAPSVEYGICFPDLSRLSNSVTSSTWSN